MGAYQVEIKSPADGTVARLPDARRELFSKGMEKLADNPYTDHSEFFRDDIRSVWVTRTMLVVYEVDTLRMKIQVLSVIDNSLPGEMTAEQVKEEITDSRAPEAPPLAEAQQVATKVLAVAAQGSGTGPSDWWVTE